MTLDEIRRSVATSETIESLQKDGWLNPDDAADVIEALRRIAHVGNNENFIWARELIDKYMKRTSV